MGDLVRVDRDGDLNAAQIMLTYTEFSQKTERYHFLDFTIKNNFSDFQFTVRFQRNIGEDDWYGMRVEFFNPRRLADLDFFTKVMRQVYRWNYTKHTPPNLRKRLDMLKNESIYKEALDRYSDTLKKLAD